MRSSVYTRQRSAEDAACRAYDFHTEPRPDAALFALLDPDAVDRYTADATNVMLRGPRARSSVSATWAE